MSRLSTAADFLREIASLDAMIAQMSSGEIDFASKLQIYSLEQRKKALSDELVSTRDDAFAGQEIDLVFTGKPVRGHSIESEFMGKMLLRTQNVVTAFAGLGESTRKPAARVSSALKQSSKLRFSKSFEGSFGMRLEAIDEQADIEGHSMLAPSIGRLVDLINAAPNLEQVVAELSSLGPNATRQFREFVSEIQKAKASVRINWPTVIGVRTAALDSVTAGGIVETLDELKEEISHDFFVGTLDEASDRRGRFGFRKDDGSTFNGIVENHVIPELAHYYSKRCRAYIRTRELTHVRAGITKRSYRLQELQPPPDDEAQPYATNSDPSSEHK